MAAPPALVALLGSSNLTIALPHALSHLLARLNGRTVTLCVAHGPGRSYQVDTGSLGIKFRALSRCDLLPAFEQARKESPSAEAWALLTDIGNDIMHGASAESLTTRIRHMVERLRNLGATVAVTSLPIEGLAAIPPWKYRLARGLIYPTSRTPQELVLAKTNAIQQELRGMESRGELRLLPARREWYGPDECHLRFRKSREAIAEWLDLLLCIDRAAPHVGKPIRPISSESLYLRCHPEYRLFHFRSPERRPFVIAPGATVHSF